MDSRRQTLIDQIALAFRGVHRRGGVSLHQTIPIDNYEGEAERAEARKLDRDGKWQNVPHEDLAEISGALCFFDVIGWRYHLPAYMTWWLSGGDDSNSISADDLLYSLAPGKSDAEGLRSWSLERYQSLDLQQSQVIAAFLRFVMDTRESDENGLCNYDATKAMKQYWHEFESDL